MYLYLLLASVALLSYLVYLAFVRLCLSPIASFPGPKLAALTRWYEFYYEVILRGQFTFHISELHKQYGTSLFKHMPFDTLTGDRTYH